MRSVTAKHSRYGFVYCCKVPAVNSFLKVCALVSDLEILEDGDESEIGERGVSYLFSEHHQKLTSFQVNLSGGQKARGGLLST